MKSPEVSKGRINVILVTIPGQVFRYVLELVLVFCFCPSRDNFLCHVLEFQSDRSTLNWTYRRDIFLAFFKKNQVASTLFRDLKQYIHPK